MVAKITFPKRIEAALNYNEQKVQKGNAFCLHAQNYLDEVCNLNYYQKLNGFQRLNKLNDMASTKTLHVSLTSCPGYCSHLRFAVARGGNQSGTGDGEAEAAAGYRMAA